MDMGAGTELKLILGMVGIGPRGRCKCNERAAMMDYLGIPWCEANIETIVDWLEEEASNRSLPFIRTAARALVRLAIMRAKRKQAILKEQVS